MYSLKATHQIERSSGKQQVVFYFGSRKKSRGTSDVKAKISNFNLYFIGSSLILNSSTAAATTPLLHKEICTCMK